MNDVVMYGEAKPFDIRKEIKHTVVDQLKIIKQIARMPEDDIALIRQVDAEIGDPQVAATKGTLTFLEKIGSHRDEQSYKNIRPRYEIG